MAKRNPILQQSLAAILSMAAVPHYAAWAQEPAADAASELEEVVVTGSRIRGAAPVGSTVIGLDREAIDVAAGVTVDRVIKELPLVFDLGVSESSRGQAGGSGNIVWGNTVNLHGIGPYATLVILDGHRTTSNTRSVDPSMIPSLGVERIEIVADGASAIYGSDAVAGVVNIVPRRSLNGVDTALRYGSADDFNEWQAGFAGGKVWDSGQVMIAYEHAYRSNLNGADRDFYTSDLRPFGGPDRRATTCDPGTLRVGPNANAANTTYAIPAAGVTPATAGSLVAGTVNLCDLLQDQDLLPKQTYDSVLLTFNQQLSDTVELFGDGFYSRRRFVREPGYATVSRQPVPATNAFYVAPPSMPAGTSTFIDYNFIGDLPRDTQTGSSTNWELTPGLRFNLPRDLRAEVLMTYGESDDQSNSYRGLNNTVLAQRLASGDPNLAFDPYGLHRSSANTLYSISNQIFLAPTLNTFRGYEARLDGPLFSLPAGQLRFATGYERQEMDASFGLGRGNPGTPVTYRDFDREVDSAYLELMAPIVGDANAVPGIAKLDVTASIRYDDYSDVGSTTNPKFGLNYAPVDSVTLRASYGTSFRAPLLAEIHGNSNNLFGQNYQNPAGGASLLGFALSGGNLDLEPEEATTWSVGADWRPANGTNVSLTFFNVTYEKQVANFLSNLSVLTFESEIPTGIILRGTQARDRVLALLAQGITLARGSFPGGDPNNVTLFVDGRNQNLGVSVTRGVDFQVSQRLDTDDAGSFRLDLSGTYFTKYESAITPEGVRVDRLNTIYNPLKLKGRAALTWELGALSSQLVFNYVNSYDNNTVTPVAKVSSFTPVDLSVTLHGDEVSWLGGFGEGLAVSLEARNVADEEPPFVDVAQSANGGGGYDPTASNPVGRLIGLRVRKSWR